MKTIHSMFDEDGILRESYDHVASLVRTQSQALTAEQRTLIALGAGAVYFFTSSLVSPDNSIKRYISITSANDVRQYGVGTALSRVLTTIFRPRVTHLCVTQSGLRHLPCGIGNLILLKEINLSGNQITSLPDEIGRLVRLEKLDVSHNSLVRLPKVALGRLSQLEELNAMGNQIEDLDISLPGSLKVLGLKDNKIKSVPESVFTSLENLRELYLTGNKLESLPESICQCQSLVKLQVSHNNLSHLPERIGALNNLELIRVACCDISEMPESLAKSPSIAWLSMSGNPCSDMRISYGRNTTRIVKDEDVLVGKKLGDGASGEVFEAEYKNQKVAFKMFRRDALSPDGHCQDEIQISCILHDEHLVKVIARVEDDQSEIHGILMEYVPGIPLAEKPNRQSLLRCRWKPDLLFSISFVLRCITGVASALEHMHSKGIAHGDVYAHNVLADDDGNSVLCDYGASFPYAKGSKKVSMYELHEVRAFGLLLRDMIERVEISFSDMEVAIDCQKQLLLMAQQCLSNDPNKRPAFSALNRKLKSLERSAASSGRTPRSDSRFWLNNRNKSSEGTRGSQTAR